MAKSVQEEREMGLLVLCRNPPASLPTASQIPVPGGRQPREFPQPELQIPLAGGMAPAAVLVQIGRPRGGLP